MMTQSGTVTASSSPLGKRMADFSRGIDLSRLKNMTDEEKYALATLGIAGTGAEAEIVIKQASRFMIRTGVSALFEYAFSQTDIDRMKEEYFQRYGKTLTFWPESLGTIKGLATGILTLGFNTVVNGYKEAQYSKEDRRQYDQETAQTVDRAKKQLARFRPL